MQARSGVAVVDPPPPDIELGLPRPPLDYHWCLPPEGIGPRTGLLIFVCGFGMRPDQTYVADKLLPSLAANHDVVAVSAAYHGIGLKTGRMFLDELPGWRERLGRHFDTDLHGLSLDDVFVRLSALGVGSVPSQFPLVRRFDGGAYQSFGLIPAMDQIAVLADALRRWPVRRDRLLMLGTSYGGYSAALALKFLPNTFHVVIENSGYVRADTREMNYLESGLVHRFTFAGVSVSSIEESPWTLVDEGSDRFVGPAIKGIRDLSSMGHWQASRTHVVSYHGVDDTLVPMTDKLAFWLVAGRRMRLRDVRVGRGDLDGRLFKTTEHGLGASMRAMATDALGGLPPAADEALTDFDRGTEVALTTGGRTYRARYAPDLTWCFSRD
ncbi:DUF2920 family protein [Aerophototrophica crusticola]|uniref:DUF2920 family protein n=1 Tax=Aerophototrophica crusticola TaxID=1709002 RepID=A0A858R785_9PROT|nr:DUF2920 family protein [Rhodospirillaceae bacterium B3]